MRDDHYWRRSVLWLALAACLPLLNVSITLGKAPNDDEAKPEAAAKEKAAEKDGKQPEKKRLRVRRLRVQTQPNQYWLGVQIGNLDDELRQQLELGEGEGVLIQDVLPEGPAAKAQLKTNDVVVSHDGEKVSGVRSLIELMASNKGEETTFGVLRDGERLEIKITPEKRPEFGRQPAGQTPGAERKRRFFFSGPNGNFQNFDEQHQLTKEAMERLRRFESEHPHFELHMLPGILALDEAEKFPENTSISVSKKNGKLATIIVERGEEKWEVTEDKISDLPKDIQPYIRRLLGITPGRIQLPFTQPNSEGKGAAAPHLHFRDGIPKDLNAEFEFNNFGGNDLPSVEEIQRRLQKRMNGAAKLRDRVLESRDSILEEIRKELRLLRGDVDRLLNPPPAENGNAEKGNAEKAEAKSKKEEL